MVKLIRFIGLVSQSIFIQFVHLIGFGAFLVAAAMNAWGDKLRPLIDKHFPLFVGSVIVIAGLGIWVAAKLF